MPLPDEQLLRLKIESAFDHLADTMPELRLREIELMDRRTFELMKLAFGHGYIEAAADRSIAVEFGS